MIYDVGFCAEAWRGVKMEDHKLVRDQVDISSNYELVN